MNKNGFEKIYIIGTGSLPLHILKFIMNYRKENFLNFDIVPISYREVFNSTFERYCLKNAPNYRRFDDKNELTDFLLKIEEKSLIISANNYFIFSENIVEKNNLIIINFHNSLLPNHRGMNAALWAMIDKDEYTGITWHKIDKEIDKGFIIYQEKYLIKKNETLYTLTKELLDIGSSYIKNNFTELLSYDYNNLKITNNKSDNLNGKYHYGDELPNNGYLNLESDSEEIDLYLRAFDDNHLNIIPKLKVKIDNIRYEIVKYYNVSEEESFNEEFDLEYIIKDFNLYLNKIV